MVFIVGMKILGLFRYIYICFIYIYICLDIFRYTPPPDRYRNSPVLNEYDDSYRNHKEMEIEPSNARMLYNNGYAANVIRKGIYLNIYKYI